MKQPTKNPALATWSSLNAAVMKAGTVKECEWLMRAEEAGRNRFKFLTRIHSRLNRLRSVGERAEIARKAPKQ